MMPYSTSNPRDKPFNTLHSPLIILWLQVSWSDLFIDQSFLSVSHFLPADNNSEFQWKHLRDAGYKVLLLCALSVVPLFYHRKTTLKIHFLSNYLWMIFPQLIAMLKWMSDFHIAYLCPIARTSKSDTDKYISGTSFSQLFVSSKTRGFLQHARKLQPWKERKRTFKWMNAGGREAGQTGRREDGQADRERRKENQELCVQNFVSGTSTRNRSCMVGGWSKNSVCYNGNSSM